MGKAKTIIDSHTERRIFYKLFDYRLVSFHFVIRKFIDTNRTSIIVITNKTKKEKNNRKFGSKMERKR